MISERRTQSCLFHACASRSLDFFWLWSALIGFDRLWSTLIGFDRLWSALIGFDRIFGFDRPGSKLRFVQKSFWLIVFCGLFLHVIELCFKVCISAFEFFWSTKKLLKKICDSLLRNLPLKRPHEGLAKLSTN